MKRKFNKAATVKRVVDGHGGIKSKKNPDLVKVLSIEAGELYQGVTDDAKVSSTADYRMLTRSDDTVNSQGS